MSLTCIIYQYMNLKIPVGTLRLKHSEKKKWRENSASSLICDFGSLCGADFPIYSKKVLRDFHTHASFTPIVSANLTLHFTHAPQSTARLPRYY